MKYHRIRKSHMFDENQLWIEIRPNEWLTVTGKPEHEAIHKLESELWTKNTFPMTFASRAFEIGLVTGWNEVEPVA
jgi:hypothetical protein